jgi:iron(III) transport system substrate-binding protein
MRTRLRPGRALLVTFLVGLVAAAAAASSGARAPVASNVAAAGPKAATAAQWARIVAAAKREGEVTIYSSQNPIYLADFAKKFQERYGIRVTVNRQIDSVLVQQLTAEHGAGKVNGDIYISATKAHILGAQQDQNRWAVDAVGPALFAKEYNRSIFAKPGKAAIVGINVNCIGWNTSQWSTRIRDFPDVLNERLKGRVGVIAPSAFSIIDFYRWVEETYGRNYLPRLAELDPKIYPSALPMTQAIASGEITVGIFAATSALDLKQQGAPIDCVIAKGDKTWNISWQGIVLRRAPHPNAAQLVFNYMLTKEGQSLVQKRLGSPLKGVPNTFYVVPRQQDLKESTAEKVAAYQKEWDGLFR